MTPDFSVRPEDGRSPSGRATHERSPSAGSSPTVGVPNASINHDLSIGIINPYGELWTWDAFSTAEAAEAHLRDFWGKDADEMVPQFKLCVVRVEVIPESAPFPMPSTAKARGEQLGTLEMGSDK